MRRRRAGEVAYRLPSATLLLTACDAHGLAAAADSWTFQGGELENPDQVKVFTLFGTFLVGTAGREYVLDFERYDFRALQEGRSAPDRWAPERPASTYLPHHLAGESSIAEVLTRWADLQAREPGLLDRVRKYPDVAEFHPAISEVMRSRYREETEFARRRYETSGKLMQRTMPMKLLSLGYRPDGDAYVYMTTFRLEPLDFSDEMAVSAVSSSQVPFPMAYAEDSANGTEWWIDEFTASVDRARAAFPRARRSAWRLRRPSATAWPTRPIRVRGPGPSRIRDPARRHDDRLPVSG